MIEVKAYAPKNIDSNEKYISIVTDKASSVFTFRRSFGKTGSLQNRYAPIKGNVNIESYIKVNIALDGIKQIKMDQVSKTIKKRLFKVVFIYHSSQ